MLRLAGCVFDGIMRSIPQCCLEQSAWRPDPTGLAVPAAYKIQLEKAGQTKWLGGFALQHGLCLLLALWAFGAGG